MQIMQVRSYNRKQSWTKREEDIKNRIQKATGTFHRLRNVYKRNWPKNKNTPVQLYECETWKLTNLEEKKLNTVQHQGLRKILEIRLQSTTSNKTVDEISNTKNISSDISRRRWTWVWHILRRERENNSGHRQRKKLEEDQKLNREKQQREKGTNKEGQVETWQEQRQNIEKGGIAAWMPYATSCTERIKG